MLQQCHSPHQSAAATLQNGLMSCGSNVTDRFNVQQLRYSQYQYTAATSQPVSTWNRYVIAHINSTDTLQTVLMFKTYVTARINVRKMRNSPSNVKHVIAHINVQLIRYRLIARINVQPVLIRLARIEALGYPFRVNGTLGSPF